MSEKPTPALLLSGEVGVHAAVVASRVDRVLTVLGKMQQDFALKHRDIDVPGQIVAIYLAHLMMDDQFRRGGEP
jgi:hypothetical protein